MDSPALPGWLSWKKPGPPGGPRSTAVSCPQAPACGSLQKRQIDPLLGLNHCCLVSIEAAKPTAHTALFSQDQCPNLRPAWPAPHPHPTGSKPQPHWFLPSSSSPSPSALPPTQGLCTCPSLCLENLPCSIAIGPWGLIPNASSSGGPLRLCCGQATRQKLILRYSWAHLTSPRCQGHLFTFLTI